MRTGSFVVMGEPVPKGSTKSFYIKKLDRTVTKNANPNTEAWEKFIKAQAQAFYEQTGLFFGQYEPVEVRAVFHLYRPPSIPKKRVEHTTKPDLDKLTRCVGDALNKVLFKDDSQVVKWVVSKRYATGPSFVEIELREKVTE